MAAAHTATLTHEGDDTVIRIAGNVPLPDGPVLIREVEQALHPVTLEAAPGPMFATLDEFMRYRDTLPRSTSSGAFMRERPGNEVPAASLPFGKEEAVV